MVRSVSSADPESLERYAAMGEHLDQELDSHSSSLMARLQHFEASCTEPEFRTSASGLGATLHSYARDLFPLDDWVRQIARRFARADGLHLGGLGGIRQGQRAEQPPPYSKRGWFEWNLKPPAWLVGIIAKLPWMESQDVASEKETKLGHLLKENTPDSAKPTPKSTKPPTSTRLGDLLTEKRRRSETADVNFSAPLDDCVKFVKGQADRKVPSGFNSKQFYSGKYKGASGVLPDKTEYGQEPRAGAIMVESPNPSYGIDYGHASYVYEVNYDETGKVISFTIAEGGVGKDKVSTAEFYWSPEQNCYVSDDGKRSPDMFIF